MKPQRILVHYPHLKFQSGGTKFVLTVASLLNKQTPTVVLTNTINNQVVSTFSDSKLLIQSLAPWSTNSIWYWALFPLAFLWDVIQTARHVRPGDVLYSTLFPSNAICAAVSLLRGTPHYHYCFEPFPFLRNIEYIRMHAWPKRGLLFLLSWCWSWLDTFAVRTARVVFTLNATTQRMIQSTYQRESIVTLMGVDTDHFSPTPNVHFKQYEPYVVHSTDYSPGKHTELAIQAFAQLPQKSPLQLLITSTRPNAPEKAALQTIVSALNLDSRVHFLDLVPYQQLPELYSNAVCYLSCSYDEMLGTASSNLPVKESLACQTPALRANITDEDVEDGTSGFLINPNDTQLVAERIHRLHSDTKLQTRMGKSGRKKMRNLYNWDRVVQIIWKTITETYGHDSTHQINVLP